MGGARVVTGESRQPTDPSQVTAVVFAGASGPPAERQGRNKNYFPLRGRPVVQFQLDLLASLGVPRIVLVTEPERAEALRLSGSTIVLRSSAKQSDNFVTVRRQVEWGESERALVLFGDTPLLSEGVVRDFLARCAAAPADFHHGLVPHAFAEPYSAFYPAHHVGRTPFHLKEFTARLGCLSLMRPAGFDAEEARRAVNTVMAGRKQDPGAGGLLAVILARLRVVWGGVRFIGPVGAWMGLSAIFSHWLYERGFRPIARVSARPVTLSRLDGVAERLLGCSARFVPCPFGGASLDVDSETDLEVLEQHLESMLRLNALQERLARKLVEPGFDLSAASLDALARFDPESAAEIRRHPDLYRRQRKILLELTPAQLRSAA